ncbi:MAG: site-specific DNA-methyltransferase [Nanoarchaeota archaeon]|nr:site-specific DNA-methyltransferase [Nanoarchaeota archaeon]
MSHPEHPCPMPLGLAEELLSCFPRGHNIIDPYCGIGTTLQAAENLGLSATGIDFEPVGFAAERLAQPAKVA